MLIKHDFHLHTYLSLCAKPEATIELYAEKAKKLGLEKMAITDHLWDHNVPDWDAPHFYGPQSFEYISANIKKIKNANFDGVEFIFGCEAEYSYKYRRPALTPEIAEQIPVILVPNSHTHITMPKDFYEPRRKHAEYMLDAFMDIVNSDVARYITAVPHPFLAVGCPYNDRIPIDLITDDEFKYCFDAAAEKGIALELNPNYLKKETLSQIYDDSIFRMYRIGKECGCKFTVGSDAHCGGGHDAFSLIYTMAAILDLKEDDFHPLTR